MTATNSRKTVFLADTALLITAILWGSGFGTTNWLLGFMSPLWLLSVRFLLTAGILYLLFHSRLSLLNKQDIILGCLLGVLLAGTFVAHIIGLLFTTPGKQSFIMGSNVVMVPILYAIFYRKMPSPVATIGAVLATAGLLVMGFTPGMSFNLGDALSLLLALGCALHVLFVGNLSRRIDPPALTFLQMASASVILTVSASLIEPFPSFRAVPLKAWLGIFYVVLFVTVIPFLMQTIAQRYSPEVHAAVLLSLESPSGYAFAVLIGEELVNAQVLLGGMIVFAGVVITELEDFILKRFVRLSNASTNEDAAEQNSTRISNSNMQ